MWGAFADYPALEFVWSFFPILILLAIGIPGLLVLYSHETESVGRLTVKVTGHQ
jgi:heme/copper-type cytochrome/quinol oxidase subunit 2